MNRPSIVTSPSLEDARAAVLDLSRVAIARAGGGLHDGQGCQQSDPPEDPKADRFANAATAAHHDYLERVSAEEAKIARVALARALEPVLDALPRKPLLSGEERQSTHECFALAIDVARQQCVVDLDTEHLAKAAADIAPDRTFVQVHKGPADSAKVLAGNLPIGVFDTQSLSTMRPNFRAYSQVWHAATANGSYVHPWTVVPYVAQLVDWYCTESAHRSTEAACLVALTAGVAAKQAGISVGPGTEVLGATHSSDEPRVSEASFLLRVSATFEKLLPGPPRVVNREAAGVTPLEAAVLDALRVLIAVEGGGEAWAGPKANEDPGILMMSELVEAWRRFQRECEAVVRNSERVRLVAELTHVGQPEVGDGEGAARACDRAQVPTSHRHVGTDPCRSVGRVRGPREVVKIAAGNAIRRVDDSPVCRSAVEKQLKEVSPFEFPATAYGRYVPPQFVPGFVKDLVIRSRMAAEFARAWLVHDRMMQAYALLKSPDAAQAVGEAIEISHALHTTTSPIDAAVRAAWTPLLESLGDVRLAATAGAAAHSWLIEDMRERICGLVRTVRPLTKRQADELRADGEGLFEPPAARLGGAVQNRDHSRHSTVRWSVWMLLFVVHCQGHGALLCETF